MLPGDSSLKGKTSETLYQTVPLKSSEKRLFLVAVFRSQTAIFFTVTITSLGASIHGPISRSHAPKSQFQPPLVPNIPSTEHTKE